jgi:hypothetical protein
MAVTPQASPRAPHRARPVRRPAPRAPAPRVGLRFGFRAEAGVDLGNHHVGDVEGLVGEQHGRLVEDRMGLIARQQPDEDRRHVVVELATPAVELDHQGVRALVLAAAGLDDALVEGVGEGAEGVRLHGRALLGQRALLGLEARVDLAGLGAQGVAGGLLLGQDRLADPRAGQDALLVEQQERRRTLGRRLGRDRRGQRQRQGQHEAAEAGCTLHGLRSGSRSRSGSAPPRRPRHRRAAPPS